MQGRTFARIFAALILFGSCPAVASGEVAQSFTLDGRLYADAAATTPLTDSDITVVVQILNSAQDCILYEETVTNFNGAISNGYFTFKIGSAVGSIKRSSLDSGHAMTKIFANAASLIAGRTFGGSACSYASSVGDLRYVRMLVTPSSDGMTRVLSPNMSLDSVPSALVAERAESVQGLGPSNLLQVNTTGSEVLSQSNLENIFSSSNYSALTALLAGSSGLYSKPAANGTLPVPTASTPTSPAAGQLWYDSGAIKFYDGSTTQTLGVSGSGITSVVAGTGLNVGAGPGGSITSSGTLNVDTGTTTGQIVQVASGNKLPVIDGSNLTLLNGSAINSGTIGGSAAVNTTGNITGAMVTGTSVVGTTGSFGSTSTGQLSLFDHATTNTNYITLKAPATASLTSDYVLTLPDALPASAGQVLTSDTSGKLTWTSPSSGSVTSVGGTAPITISGTGAVPVVNVSAATTTTSGVVTLAADGGTTASTVVQATDARLSDARLPSNNSDLLKVSAMPANCAAGSSLTFSSPSGSWVCTTIPDATASSKGIMQVGTGLSVASGTVSLTSGIATPGTYSKVTVDTYGRVTTTGNIGSSDVITALNFTPLNKAGDVMSGTLGLNSIATAAETTLVTGFGTSDAGKMWFNTDLKKIHMWNGTAIVSVASPAVPTITQDGQSLRWNNTSKAWEYFTAGVSGSGIGTFNTLTGNTQTLANGSAGTAPAWVSAGSTHTLNIPMASTSSVTAGLISKADYDSFNGKISASYTLAGDVTGTPAATSVDKIKGKAVTTPTASGQMLVYDGTGITPVAMSSDATMAATGAVTLKNTGTAGTYYKVTTDAQGRVSSGVTSLTSADLTDTSDLLKASNMPAACSADKTLTFSSPSGTWACSSIAGLDAGAITTGTIADARLPASVKYWTAATGGINYAGGNVGIGTTTPTSPLTVAGNIAMTSAGSKLTTAATELVLEQTGDTYGPIRMHLQNRNGSNGAIFENANIDLVDFGFVPSSGAQNNIRMEHRAAQLVNSGNSGGEFQLIDPLANAQGDVWLATGKSATIFNMGKVGIGTTSPSEKLDVNGKIKGTELCIGTDCRSAWPASGGGGTVTSVASGTGLTGGPITSTGTLAVDVGTTVGKIVQVDTGNKLPVIDGSQLTNLNASNLASGTIPDARMPALTGDVTTSVGSVATTLAKIQGKSLAVTSPAIGNVLKYDGSGWVNAALSTASLSDAGDLLKATSMPATCSADKTLTFSSPTGTWVCSSIAIDAAAIASGTIADARLPASAKYWSAATGGINYAGGSVGIGTTSPAYSLHLRSATPRIALEDTDDSNGSIGTITAYQDGTMFYDANNNNTATVGGHAFRADGGTKNLMTMLNNGNVGIGTTTPGGALHVEQSLNGSQLAILKNSSNGAGATTSLLVQNDQGNGVVIGTQGSGNSASTFGSNTSGWGLVGVNNTANGLMIYSGSSGPVAVATNGVERLRVLTNGNVGIGTTSPTTKLHVSGGSSSFTDTTGANGGQTVYVANTTASGTNYGVVSNASGSGATNNTGIYVTASGATNNYGVRSIVAPAATSYAVYADGGAQSYFQGNVGVGTATPAAKLEVAGGAVIGTGVGAKTIGVVTFFTPTGSTSNYIHIKTPFKPSVHSNMYHFKVEGFEYQAARDIDITFVGYSYVGNPTVISNPYSRDPQGIFSPTQYIGSNGFIYLRFKPSSSTYYMSFRVDSTYVGNGRIIYPGEMTVTASDSATL